MGWELPARMLGTPGGLCAESDQGFCIGFAL